MEPATIVSTVDSTESVADRLLILECCITRWGDLIGETTGYIGKALKEIRDDRLYRDTHSTFEAYCQERWGFTRMRASQLIAAALVAENVNNCLQTPTHESQVRPLTPLSPEEQIKVWEEAVATAPGGKPPTAAHVRSVVSRIKAAPAVRVAAVAAPVNAPVAARMPEDAFACTKFAMVHMSKIRPDDPKKLEAGMYLLEWLIEHTFGGFDGYMEYVHSPEAKKAARRRTK